MLGSVTTEEARAEEKAMGKSIVAITRGTEAEAVRKALELIGGLREIIREEDRVLVKPNFCGAEPQGTGVTTNVKVVEAVAKEVQAVGGIPIVGESCIGSTPESTERALKASGVKEVAQRLGIEVVNFDSDNTVNIPLPGGKVLDGLPLPRTVLDCGVRVSVPVLKFHGEATVTLGLKNMKGCLPGRTKSKCHHVGLDQSIVDYNTVLKPHLTVIDGTVAGAWKAGQKTVRLDVIIAGFDPVATDSVGALALGVKPEDVRHLVLASEAGLGTNDARRIEIRGIPVEEIALNPS